ncbi:3-deoxy-D-manno-octulosonic acid transferase [Novacetimonas hansenii]|uniref:3-deoxy-D-manno-octulosonic acid transferase n=1 Tax=Novacetimonas hansenii TaxID=436 RepID=UPI000789BA07|nr:3-deoxy-D-manno-octulosonic acid transferase [Novacetimonas hansenii]RFP01953.1 3-deoxy-D-manno-octulosonic acid transferase [Novacetimonas hansenii]WEQ59252.1 3-deoxy-D-manno-octulosonic acid transferase [Novacetimonas hansenii]CUW47200.1 3-deoxy-D-manno-octulosonic acid transferase [Novacetimonas hansenii]
MQTHVPQPCSLTFRDRICGHLSSAAWAGVATMLAPILRIHLARRVRRGKEIAARVGERQGIATCLRPDGPLLWLHAVSVGETLSILPVIAALHHDRPDLHFLVTTATTTSAALLSQRMRGLPHGGRIIHQFVPLDVPAWMRRFVRHWHPDAAILTESELWPNMTAACLHDHVPVLLINGRMSDRSFAMWRRLPCLIGAMLRRLTWACARSAEDAQRFHILGRDTITVLGDLKDAAPPPQADTDLALLRRQIGQRPVWIAASTHPGEEEIILHAASLAREHVTNLLTILIPRHPERGAAVMQMARQDIPRRALGQVPGEQDSIWICDTMGEMGLFYALHCPVLMGNSLLPAPQGGGHNPMEPARLGNALASGPSIANFRQAFMTLGAAVTYVTNAHELAHWVVDMLSHQDRLRDAIRASRCVAANDTQVARRVATGIIKAVYH